MILLVFLSTQNWVDTNDDYPGVPTLNNWTMLRGMYLPIWLFNAVQIWGVPARMDAVSSPGLVVLAVLLFANSMVFYGIGSALLAAGIDTKYHVMASFLPIMLWWAPASKIYTIVTQKFPSKSKMEKRKAGRARRQDRLKSRGTLADEKRKQKWKDKVLVFAELIISMVVAFG